MKNLFVLMLVLGIAFLFVATQQGLANIVYDDGAIHNINTVMPEEMVEIWNGSTVNVFSGGSLYGGNQTLAHGIANFGCFLNIYDGDISGGGGVDTWAANGICSSQEGGVTYIYGGNITGGSGSLADGIQVSDSLVSIYGGTVSGGNGISASGMQVFQSLVNIYGGTISGGSGSYSSGGIMVSSDGSTVNVYGGTISGGTGSSDNYGLRVDSGGSVINIYGSNFNYDFGPITDTYGTLTGILSNGTPLNVTFAQSYPDSIILIPEPATICLLGLGGLALLRNRKK